MHVEILLNGDTSGCPIYEYNYIRFGVIPPISVGDIITLSFREDDYPDQETGRFKVTNVEHFFSAGGYILAVYVDRIGESL